MASSSAPRTAYLISGAGSTMAHLVALERSGALPVRSALAVCTVAGAAGLARAAELGLEARLVARAAYARREAFAAAVDEALREREIELVLMAGLIHLWPIAPRWAGRVLNVHPSLIPSFCGRGYYDRRVHEAVIESGVKLSGCTVHFADERYDTGPIILQRAVCVRYDDTVDALRARVQDAERAAYAEAIALWVAGRLRVDGRRVEVLPPLPAAAPAPPPDPRQP